MSLHQMVEVQVGLTGVLAALNVWMHFKQHKAMKQILARKTHIKL